MKSLVFFAIILIYSKCSYLRRDNNNILNQENNTIESLKEVINTLITKLNTMSEENTSPHVKYCIRV
jgi:hypothetical protein